MIKPKQYKNFILKAGRVFNKVSKIKHETQIINNYNWGYDEEYFELYFNLFETNEKP